MAQQFQLESFIFVIILIIYVTTSHLIEIKKVPYLHQSAIAIFMGMLTALFARYAFDAQIQFNPEVFFAIILPPIIFSAGYSLRKSLFFENFGMTSFLGVIGTIIGFICLTSFLIAINSLIFDALSLTQLMMISSVLCATDTVAAMSLIKPQKYPVLNAVLFGQGIINDAVAIILFRTITQLDIGENGVTGGTIVAMALDFCYLFFFSLALGIVCGFGLSYLFKISQSFSRHPIKETSLILLNGYFTYLLGELLGFSGIICLFTCAIIMGHYCFMNISEESQRGTGLAFETVSYIAQAFVFAYLGAAVFSIAWNWYAIGMAILVLVALPFIRAIMVYTLPAIYFILRKPFILSGKQLKICWYSGLIRGVIAFALCLQIPQQNNGNFIVLVTLVIVMVTTVVGSTMLQSFAKCIGVKQSNDQEQGDMNLANFKDQRQGALSSRYNNIGTPLNLKESTSTQNVQGVTQQQQNTEVVKSKRFQWFENQFIRPYFEKRSNSTTVNYEMQQVKSDNDNRIRTQPKQQRRQDAQTDDKKIVDESRQIHQERET